LAGWCEPMGVELANVQRIPVRVRTGKYCKPLNGMSV
jgi:hypothetical protein